MKLKTLEELFSSNKNEKFIDREVLKQEAIKWVKQWRDLRFLNRLPSPKLPKSMKEQADELMMSFFDIKEDNLK